MIVSVGVTPTRIAYVNTGDVVVNEGTKTAYVDTIIANVITAPASSAVPVIPGASVPWSGTPGMLYGIDPTGGRPGIGVMASAGLPSRLPERAEP